MVKRGDTVQITFGSRKRKIGSVAKLNGSTLYVVPHELDEVVLRGVGDISSTAKLFVVKREHVREIEPFAVYKTGVKVIPK